MAQAVVIGLPATAYVRKLSFTFLSTC